VIDVGPYEAERFADPEAGVGEDLEQQPVRACVFEQEGELLGFEDRDLFGRPVRLLGRFELADGIAGEPAAADGVAADLVQLESNAPPGGRSVFGLREQVCVHLEGDVWRARAVLTRLRARVGDR
jgi:hypothetical protein